MLRTTPTIFMFDLYLLLLLIVREGLKTPHFNIYNKAYSTCTTPFKI